MLTSEEAKIVVKLAQYVYGQFVGDPLTRIEECLKLL